MSSCTTGSRSSTGWNNWRRSSLSSVTQDWVSSRLSSRPETTRSSWRRYTRQTCCPSRTWTFFSLRQTDLLTRNQWRRRRAKLRPSSRSRSSQEAQLQLLMAESSLKKEMLRWKTIAVTILARSRLKLRKNEGVLGAGEIQIVRILLTTTQGTSSISGSSETRQTKNKSTSTLTSKKGMKSWSRTSKPVRARRSSLSLKAKLGRSTRIIKYQDKIAGSETKWSSELKMPLSWPAIRTTPCSCPGR